MAAPSGADLLRRIGRLEHRTKQLEDRLEKLTSRFALYWFDERKPPAFAVILSAFPDGDDTLANLYIVTEHLGKADVTLRKPMLKGSDLVKNGKWEPMILPKVVEDLLSAQLKEEAPDDGNSAIAA